MGATTGARLRGAVRATAHAIRTLPHRWRRSLQFRVVTVTMVLSLGVAVGLGFFILQRVSLGILQTRQDVSREQATSGFDTARRSLGSKTTADPTSEERLVDQELCSGSANGRSYQVMVVLQQPIEVFPYTCWNLIPASIPAQLSAQVENDTSGQLFHQFATVSYGPGSNRATSSSPALVYGKRVIVNNGDADYTADIYYAFPLDQDQATLHLVELSVIFAGIVLVLVLVGIAWFVTRQVVMPVRMAAGIAERLAAGRLEERMRARGEDDLASLATSFNKMAANLQSQIRRLEELSRVQRRFVSDVSHELRTPLTTVRMAADLIHEERDSFEPSVARSAELLQNQLDRFEELLADLLEISRFDAGAAILEAEPVDLRDLVQRVVDSCAPLAEHKGGAVIVAAPAESCVAEVDTRRIDRILRNLVVNAIEHGEGRDVTVKIATSDEAVAVAVRDHGVGLRPGESSLVFNRFWRADPARARTTGGTGLGLAIALEDARLHHGWLQAWGEPGGGSQFRLTIPRTTKTELLRSPIPLEPEDSSHHLRRRRTIPAPPIRVTPRHPGAAAADPAGEPR